MSRLYNYKEKIIFRTNTLGIRFRNSKTLTLHLGVHKTGSTSIQKYMRTYQEKLEEVGYFYPKIDHHKIGWHFLRRKNMRAIADIRQQISATDCKNIIVSAEDLEWCDAEEVYKVFGDIVGQVKVIFYVRRQDNLLASEINQSLKMGFGFDTLDNWVQARIVKLRGDYYQLAESWRKVIGRKNITIRNYEDSAVKKDVLSDFLNHFNLPRFEDKAFGRENNSLPVQLLPLLNKMCQMQPNRREVIRCVRIMANYKHYSFDDSRNYYLIPIEKRMEILRSYNVSNTKLAERYLKTKMLFQFDEKQFSDKQCFDLKHLPQDLVSDFCRAHPETSFAKQIAAL